MSLWSLSQWVKSKFHAAGPRAGLAARRQRRGVPLSVEALEDRLQLSTASLNVVFGDVNVINSYVNVGFHRDPVGNVKVVVNNHVITDPNAIKAEINWGDGTGWQKGELAPDGKDSLGGLHFLVKGDHTYTRSGLEPIKVRITAGGQSQEKQTCGDVARLLPNQDSLPGQRPTYLAGSQPLAPETFNIGPANSSEVLTGSISPELDLGTLSGYRNNLADPNPGDYRVQINWGDSSTWEKGDVVSNPNWQQTKGPMFELKGSHKYDKAGDYHPVLYLTGPDGQTQTFQTSDVIARSPKPPVGDVFNAGTGTHAVAQQPAPVTPTGDSQVGGITVHILPDETGVKDLSGAKTNVHWEANGKYETGSDGTVSKIDTVPFSLAEVSIQTRYGTASNANSTSAYGRGTTDVDKENGNTSLGFHESQHRQDDLDYLRLNPLPKFEGEVGMTRDEFDKKVTDYQTKLKEYCDNLNKYSDFLTDDVGTTRQQWQHH